MCPTRAGVEDNLLDARAPTGNVAAHAVAGPQVAERLIIASFVNTQNVFAEATLSEPVTGLGNIFTGTDGLPREGAGRFVVSTPDVETFTLWGLIGLAVVIVGLVLLKTLLMLKLMLHAYAHGDGDAAAPPAGTAVGPRPNSAARMYNDDGWARFKAFSTINLLRNVYEGGRGAPGDDWKCCEEFSAHDPAKLFRLVKCNNGACGCGGHIETDGVPVQDPPSPISRDPIDDGEKR